jgi:hypothetical protein
MSRNASGTYTLAAGNPVVTGTVIESTWANDTLTDVATEMTDSLSRTGKGGMLAPLKTINGTVGAPVYTFTNFPTSGMYIAGVGDVRMAISGVDRMRWLASGNRPQIRNAAEDAWENLGASVTVADEATDTTCFPLFATAATGIVQPKTNTTFTFDSDTGNVGIGGNLAMQALKTVDGRDVSVDGTKLDTIAENATADQTDEEIRAAVEAATDSNVFTDDDHDKLDAMLVSNVVYASDNSQTNVTSTSWVDIGLSLSITPSTTTSRIQLHLAIQNTTTNTAGHGMSFRFVRNSTALTTPTAGTQIYNQDGNTHQYGFSDIEVDSPATTSAITYKVQVRGNSSSGTRVVNIGGVYNNRLIATEIGA